MKFREFLTCSLIWSALLCGSAWGLSDPPVPDSANALTVVSAATFRGEKLAPDSIAIAFGTGLATETQVAETADLPTTLAGTQVLVTDSVYQVRTAGLFFVSSGQVNFQIPPGTAAGAALVTLLSGDGSVSRASVNIAPVSPGLFTADNSGKGVAAAWVVVVSANGSGTKIPAFQCGFTGCIANPIDLGGSTDEAVLELFGTGIRGRSSLGNVICTINGTIAAVRYAGPQDGSTGLDQVNVILPRNLGAQSAVDISLTVDSVAANPVSITFASSTSLAAGRAADLRSRASQLVGQMTLNEKIQELHGIEDANHFRTVPELPRLNIPALNITNGPAGVTNGGPGHDGAATALPAPISLAATWDVHMARLYGSIIGQEARFLANGFLEGPDINIARVPQNGRNFEAFGEDPFLAGQIAAGDVEGIQSHGVIAEAKHYAGNNQERDRGSINAVIDERTLREIYLPAFETTVKQSHVGGIMCAYNQVNGAFSCENQFLLNQVLRKEWGFDGIVTSDFGAVHSTVPSLMAGLDVEMPTGVYFANALQLAAQSGAVQTPAIDEKLVRRFATMMRLGVFDNPPAKEPIPIEQDGAVSRQLAEAGMVLLKNSGILPLNPGDLRSVVVIGPYATAAKTGGGGSAWVTPAYTVDPVPGIQNRVGPLVSVRLADGSDIAGAVSLAASADVVIVMVGDDETEGADHSIALRGSQDDLVKAVAAANSRTVVVVKSGGPVLMPWAGSVPAILEAWYPGEEDGNAVAAVLFGEVNPSGKLPITFPQGVADLPTNTPEQYPGVNGAAHYSEGVFVGYRHYDAHDKIPLFPFGHGLSYTTFTFQNLQIAADKISVNGDPTQTVAVDFDITNTGNVAGAEVGQLYVGMPSSAVPQPPKQLKGFQKIALDPGATGHAHLLLDRRAFSYWDVSSESWRIAPGTYQIMVGSSSRDIRLRGQITIN